MLSQAAPLRGEHPERLHGAALLPLQWDLQQSSRRPVSRQVRGLHLHINLKLPTAPDEVDHLACLAVLDPAAFRCEVHVVASSQQVAGLPGAVSAQEPREPSKFALIRRP